MAWVIFKNGSEKDSSILHWSDTDGWTDGDNFETYTYAEAEKMSLPEGGQWHWVPWQVQ